MALIDCHECRHKVSDKAVSCPKCGFPVAFHQKEQRKLKNVKKPTKVSKPLQNTYNTIDAVDATAGCFGSIFVIFLSGIVSFSSIITFIILK